MALVLTIVLLTGLFSESMKDVGGVKFSAGALVVSAAKSNTQQQIDQAEKEKQELEKEKKEHDAELSDLKQEQKGLKKELNNLNAQLLEVVENLDELDSRIREKEQQIADAQSALEIAFDNENKQYDLMVQKVRYMYENKEKSYLNAILQENSLFEVLNTADYVEKVAAYDQKVMEDYVANRELIESLQVDLDNEKTELDGLKAKAEAEKSKVDGMIASTKNSIADYASQISEAEQIALEYEAELKKAEEDLKVLKKKLEEEMALSQAAANASWRNISEVTFAEGDRKLLANIIYCEAGGESYAGKLAVGSVVINRMLSSKFPDTVVGVVYQKSQFSPASSGRLALALASDKATQACYQAADEAMSGMTNVGSCVYFRRPTPGLTGTVIGNHVFY